MRFEAHRRDFTKKATTHLECPLEARVQSGPDLLRRCNSNYEQNKSLHVPSPTGPSQQREFRQNFRNALRSSCGAFKAEKQP